MVSIEGRVAALVDDFTPSVDEFEAAALRHLARCLGCDGAWFATIGPQFSAKSPPYFQRILADPQRFDPEQQRAREIVARFGTTFIDTEAYTPAERDRLPVFRELLRPAGISSVVLSMVDLGGNTTGTIHLARSGRPFDPDALARARPLFRAIAIMHRAVVDVPRAPRAVAALARLSPHEREVALLAGEGYGALQIAARLGKSVHTVRRQLESIYRKCAIGNRAELAALVQQARPAPAAQPKPSSRMGAGLLRILDSAQLRPAVRAEEWHAIG